MGLEPSILFDPGGVWILRAYKHEWLRIGYARGWCLLGCQSGGWSLPWTRAIDSGCALENWKQHELPPKKRVNTSKQSVGKFIICCLQTQHLGEFQNKIFPNLMCSWVWSFRTLVNPQKQLMTLEFYPSRYGPPKKFQGCCWWRNVDVNSWVFLRRRFRAKILLKNGPGMGRCISYW